MFVPLENTPLRYAWGADGAITAYLGTEGAVSEPELHSTDKPLQAELWLGAHYGSPARIVDPHQVGGHANLREWIHADPDATLGDFAKGLRSGEPVRLPFLLKVLAASEPLSLQVHPNLPRARSGFEAENAAGIPLDAPNRNYRDPFHKPEVLVALSETMTAVAGFRHFAEVRELVADIERAAANAGMMAQFAPFSDRVRVLETSEQLRELVEFNLSGSAAAHDAAAVLQAWCRGEGGWQRERQNVESMLLAHAGDPSVLTVLLMNHLTLHCGEAVYVRAGVLHAYIEGVGLEIMAASDNVLRGGLTQKHIDAPELLSVLEFAPTPPPFLGTEMLDEFTTTLEPDEPDFRLQRVQGAIVDTTVTVVGPSVLLNLGVDVEVVDVKGERAVLHHGEAVFVTPDAPPLQVRGEDVDLVVASAGVDAEEDLPLE